MTNPLNGDQDVTSAVRRLTAAADRGQNIAPATAAFIEATSKLPVRNVRAWEREIRHEIDHELYRASRSPARTLTKLLPIRRRFLIPWLDLFDGDGFRRERVIRLTCEGAPNAFLFAVLVRRLNDWVPQVRVAARQSIPQIAKATRVEFVSDVLWEILPNVHSWGRWQIEELETLADLTSLDGMAANLASRLKKSTSGPAASILGQAGRRAGLDAYLPDIAEEAIQPAVRAKAYQCLLERRVSWLEGRKWNWTDKRYGEGRFEPVLGEREIQIARPPTLETLRKAVRDKSAIVRRIAGTFLVMNRNELGAEAVALAKDLSRDRNPSVAERGAFVLKNV